MRHLLLIATVVLPAAGTLLAQPAGHWGTPLESSHVPRWQAQWIWLPEPSDADMLLARKTFTLPQAPDKAVLSITAGSRYQLFVNGRYHGNGPARSAAHHQSYDVLDIRDGLRKGKNVLAVRVHFQREDVSYYGPSRAGLLAQLDCTLGSEALTLHTDASWRVSPDESWLNTSPPMARFHLEVCDRVDLRRAIRGWADVEFDDTTWPRARVLRREEGWPSPQPNDRPTHLIPPWTSLVARDIPYLKTSVSTARQLVHVGSIPAPQDDPGFIGDHWAEMPAIPRIAVPKDTEPAECDLGSQPTDESSPAVAEVAKTFGDSPCRPKLLASSATGIISPLERAPGSRPVLVAANEPGKCRTLVYDMGEVQNGRPYLHVVAPAGTVVDVVSSPYLLDGSVPSPVVVSSYVDRIVLSGERDRWEAFYMKPARWLAVVFRYLPGEAQIHGAGLVRSEYPFVQKGQFQTPDFPELQTLWEAAAKTIRVCTTDAYTDNYRERRQYAQTAYYACLGNYPVFGDFALQLRYLRQIAQEQLPNGIMPAYAPRHGNDFMVILDSNCFWIRGLHQYLLWSGDRATTRDLLLAARNLLSLLHSYTNSDGLIESPAYPYWLDHALNDRRGVNFCFNSHYLGALEDFTQILDWLDEPDADIYRQRAQQIRGALRERLWDAERRLFADALIDGELSEQFSEHANAMAMALRIATPEQMKAVAAQLSQDEPHDFIRRESGLVMVTPAMSHFLHAGLCEAGYADQSWDLLWARFAHMLAPETNGTLWEEWWLDASGRNGRRTPRPSGRSDAQTESAFPPGLFSRYILGIQPTNPGLREVVLRYYPSNRLLRRRGVIPTPSGTLEVKWDISPAEFEISLKIPPATTVRVDLASLGMPSPAQITLDGKPISPSHVENAFLAISAGDHTLQVNRR